ncbi:MAG: TIGR02757 family protein [Flavobacteriaceae bacterium]|nr:TIGR02757 family protein [Flavobacteriaceae bacterium]MDG1963089.1 TIGR02757 family protein [Flavobacteriaceae bacterium]
MNQNELKSFLDTKFHQYYNRGFTQSDPLQIPHRFTQKEDIEIAALLTATISWGQRPTIIKNALKMMSLMDDAPYDFIVNHKPSDLSAFDGFVHRTFNSDDLIFFVKGLRHIYKAHHGLESVFAQHKHDPFLHDAIFTFRECMCSVPHQKRSEKHLSNPLNNSAAKRLHMFLRWMVRPSDEGIDFGLWRSLKPSQLSCPLDVHTGNVARKLGMIKRKPNDRKALDELDNALRALDPLDPVRYDYALFGLGIFENF